MTSRFGISPIGVDDDLEGDNDDPFDWARAARGIDKDSTPGLGDSLVLARRRNAPAASPLNRKSSNGLGSSVAPGSASLSSLADLPSL